MKWGLIGASSIAENRMIGAFRESGDEIIAVQSSNAGHAAEFAARNDIAQSVTDLQQLLEQPGLEAVYISSTNEKHFDQAMAAIAAGKHVLCEKPLAMTISDAVGMVRAAEKAGTVFATNHHLRNAASHRAIRDLIRQGAIGEVLSARVFHAVNLPEALQGWRIDSKGAGGGVILDIVVHDADTIRFHLGEGPEEVTAMTSTGRLGKGVEDGVMSVWTMPSGILVQTHESFTHAHAGTGIEFHGTDGSIFARGVMTQNPNGEIILRRGGEATPVSFQPEDLYQRGVRAFGDAVQGKGRPAADGRDGVASLAVALAVSEAAETGQRTRVDYGGF
ncbi:Gfo/Idh/MocA family protein [Paracoccus aerodenitrificans]|uniref:Gfo/Idh/MocA family protein n=1 Tax=Paracoccus aerodenitrificans TaxID=3017781 RepID=UPI0022F06C1B|nr:Gfo/Idh/MocA family oxidoreductase [Paracoccus aerodenitrificans]WBU65289.1 Gfo/Idh/MocA family oxidoreductase [Paracoccus aerodenitrificans]